MVNKSFNCTEINMKKILIITLFILCVFCRVSASEKTVDTLTKIENSILGATYSDQKTEKRLERIEKYVYGRKKQGNSSERLKRLAKDVNADMIG